MLGTDLSGAAGSPRSLAGLCAEKGRSSSVKGKPGAHILRGCRWLSQSQSCWGCGRQRITASDLGGKREARDLGRDGETDRDEEDGEGWRAGSGM